MEKKILEVFEQLKIAYNQYEETNETWNNYNDRTIEFRECLTALIEDGYRIEVISWGGPLHIFSKHESQSLEWDGSSVRYRAAGEHQRGFNFGEARSVTVA